MDVAEKGDLVSVEYDLKFINGKPYDSNLGKDPLVFRLGEGLFFPGFEESVYGMHIGESKQIVISAERMFGEKRVDLIRDLSRDDVPSHIKVEVGNRVEIKIANEEPFEAVIAAVFPDKITLDANPVVAGQDFKLFIRVLDIEVLES